MTLSIEQCLKMLADYGVPREVQEHSLVVAQVAVRLAEALHSKGYDLDLSVIEAAALLHDIARAGRNHPQAGAEIIAAKGHARVAEVVRQHMRPIEEERDRVSEITVVYIADKYVCGREVVSLEQRFDRRRRACRCNPAALQAVEENSRIARAIEGLFEHAIGGPGSLWGSCGRENTSKRGVDQMRALFQTLRQSMSNGEDTMLVTVLAHSGSTPRGAGSRMLVSQHGRIHGTIGGGAVEYRSQSIAADALRRKESCVKSFDLTPNQVEDLGMICGGRVEVYFQYIAAADKCLLSFVARALTLFDRDEDAWLVTEVGDEGIGKMGLYSKSEGLSGLTMPSRDLDRLLTNRAAWIESEGKRYFADPLVMAGRVIIFGGGHIAQELVPVISRVGFRCVVVDDRPEFASPELFPLAEQVIAGEFERIAESVTTTGNDYIVVVTRGHSHDYAVQEQVLRRDFAYVGVVGSRTKIAKTNARLLEAGISQESIDRVHTPIGMAIKAETPAELAISIAGELIMVRAERRGR